MTTVRNASEGVKLAVVAALLISIQIHTTLPVGTLGLRVSLGDLLLPISLALLSARGELRWRELSWRSPGPEMLFLGAASLWLVIAIVHGRVQLGTWQSWAVLNRGLGWAMLIGYLAFGWAATAGNRHAIERFGIKYYLLFFWFYCILSAALMITLSHRWFGLTTVAEPTASAWEQTFGLVTGTSRFQGLVVNPNAFGLLAVAALALQLPFVKSRRLFSFTGHILGLGISLFGLAWSFSLGSWLGAAAALTLLAVLRLVDYRALLLSCVVAAGLTAALILFSKASPLPAVYSTFDDPVALSGGVGSLRHRWSLLIETISLWREAPIVGAGVGTFLGRQVPTPADPLATIHSSYLWLLAETGLLGLAVVGAFFFVVFRRLLRNSAATHDGELGAAGAALLFAFGAEAIALDALYQRHLWFIIGVALASIQCSQDQRITVRPLLTL